MSTLFKKPTLIEKQETKGKSNISFYIEALNNGIKEMEKVLQQDNLEFRAPELPRTKARYIEGIENHKKRILALQKIETGLEITSNEYELLMQMKAPHEQTGTSIAEDPAIKNYENRETNSCLIS